MKTTLKIMLQKIVNGIAIVSGVVSLAVVGTVGYVYVRKDAIIENVKSKVVESILPSVPLPSLPSVTGGAQGLPSPSNPVPSLPSF
jgi:uncharacterized membrane-anchored protein